ncbi:RNA polymerase II elongation factor ELL-like [Aplochiton taeniatus]
MYYYFVMAALKQDCIYGLFCKIILKTPPSKTLYHVKLTDTAIRSLETYQNLRGYVPTEPSICFKGSQGYIKIPNPSPQSPGGVRVFSFYLSRESKDKPQASFDCVHHYASSDGVEKLEDQGSIQDKITVCATEASYQVTRERMSQLERDSWSRTAIEIKPGVSHQRQFVRFQQRSSPLSASPSFQNDSSNTKSNSTQGTVSTLLCQRPLLERVIHLLALKPYRKLELLLWLERDRASTKDKADLGAVLEEVAQINPNDNSFLLKDDFYKHIQSDWPGYGEEEKEFINKLVAKKLQLHIGTHSPCLRTNWMITQKLFLTQKRRQITCCKTYSTISRVEQRQRYLEDFCAEYDEYKDLHSRIASITRVFVQLGAKIKSLPFGTVEYKVVEDQILEKYNEYTKEFPGYRKDKKRCEYLHEKLSHIQNLIIDYDSALNSL